VQSKLTPSKKESQISNIGRFLWEMREMMIKTTIKISHISLCLQLKKLRFLLNERYKNNQLEKLVKKYEKT
jgi:hypothetical protein